MRESLGAKASRRIPAIEVAKLVRQALRAEFGRTVKFKVRTKWMGLHQNIFVTWPSRRALIIPKREEVPAVGHFHGSINDGLDNWVERPTEYQGEWVQFENNYIFLDPE